MRNFLLFIGLIIFASTGFGQELNANVYVDAEQTGQQNNQIFKTLEQQLTEFLNTRSWTDESYLNQERIDCNFTLIISSFDGTSFSGSLQVQSSRPAFNSSYNSPIYNYNDKQVAFEYKEFEPLVFNINQIESNLVALISYHAYTVIGLDAASFQENGGDTYFEIAKQIVNTASSGSYAGWKSTDGTQSRYRFNDAMVSNVYKEFQTAIYTYHRSAIDIMESDPKQAKQNIIQAIKTLKSINDRRPNSFVLRTFFDAKVDEIKSIFSSGPQVNTTVLKEALNRMAPTRRSAWGEIN
tara:strand:- start:22590 stop:23477 length:888 start_codon:yes stop_codon:yes gene_type:complete